MAENGKTTVGFEYQLEKFVCCLTDICICTKEFQPLLTMELEEKLPPGKAASSLSGKC